MPSLWAKSLGIPDFRYDRLKWNEGWEGFLKRGPSSQTLLARAVKFRKGVTAEQRDGILAVYQDRLSQLCLVQRDVTVLAQACLMEHNLESKWRTLDASVRQEHILEGLVRTCMPQTDIEDGRAYCHEVTLPSLQENGGEGFLQLLKSCMIRDTSLIPTKPMFLPYPPWEDPMMESDGSVEEEEEKAFLTVERNTFICISLSFTFMCTQSD
jgi:hypothetical protein